jgi:LysM repeat protein
MNAIYDYGKRQKEKGKKEVMKKMAKYMIKEGKTDQEIQKETGLTPEEIQKLKFKRNQIPIPEI